MPKYNVMVECRNAGEAGYIAVQLAQSHYPEFDEFEPVRTEAVR